MGTTRNRVAPDEAPLLDFWAYVDAIDEQERGGYVFANAHVRNAFNIDHGRWQHVLLDSPVPLVHLVVVIDGDQQVVHGHYLLDLRGEYGLQRPDHN